MTLIKMELPYTLTPPHPHINHIPPYPAQDIADVTPARKSFKSLIFAVKFLKALMFLDI